MTTRGVVALRPVQARDAELLYSIYASTREDELAPLPWDNTAREAFLRMQFAAQDRHYRVIYPDASYDLIVAGVEVLGRLYVHRGADVVHVIDLALLPKHRGRGIGTRLLQDMLAEAATAGSAVRIHVERFNPARRLYDRLGFREIEDQGIYLLLERLP